MEWKPSLDFKYMTTIVLFSSEPFDIHQVLNFNEGVAYSDCSEYEPATVYDVLEDQFDAIREGISEIEDGNECVGCSCGCEEPVSCECQDVEPVLGEEFPEIAVSEEE